MGGGLEGSERARLASHVFKTLGPIGAAFVQPCQRVELVWFVFPAKLIFLTKDLVLQPEVIGCFFVVKSQGFLPKGGKWLGPPSALLIVAGVKPVSSKASVLNVFRWGLLGL